MSDDHVSSSVTASELRQFIERIERLESEKADLNEMQKEVFAEMKARGFDVKAVKAIIKMRKEDTESRAEFESVLGVYMDALGMS